MQTFIHSWKYKVNITAIGVPYPIIFFHLPIPTINFFICSGDSDDNDIVLYPEDAERYSDNGV